MKKYIYPKLSHFDFGFFRFSGPGLGNCMYFAARSCILAKRLGCEMIRPTWERFGIGQYIRKERDKRNYRGLFKSASFWYNLKKFCLILFTKRIAEKDAEKVEAGLVSISSLTGYFHPLLKEWELVRDYFDKNICPDVLKGVPENMKSSVAVHVRLGDFAEETRIPLRWYKGVIEFLNKAAGRQLDVQVFSDGSDEELKELLEIEGVRRVFYGSALADMYAISRCGLLIGSHSTFSGWGAYLGQVPSIFSRCDYGKCLKDADDYCLIGDSTEIPAAFLSRLSFIKG